MNLVKQMRFAFLCKVCVTLGLAIESKYIFAETELERQISIAPMPHLAKPVLKAISAHMMNSIGYLDAEPSNDALLADIRIALTQCVRTHKENGLPFKIQSEWPNYLNGLREDSYFAKNFSITYSTSWVYGPNAMDCSLIERKTEKATLKSIAGICSIDLIKKTAKGRCEWDAHRDVASMHEAKSSMLAAPIEKVKSGAEITASSIVKMREAMPASAGPSKIILGIACDPVVVMGDTHCVAKGGSFEPKQKMVLERSPSKGFKMRAKSAALDIQVDESLFAPHLIDGFTVQNSEKR